MVVTDLSVYIGRPYTREFARFLAEHASPTGQGGWYGLRADGSMVWYATSPDPEPAEMTAPPKKHKRDPQFRPHSDPRRRPRR